MLEGDSIAHLSPGEQIASYVQKQDGKRIPGVLLKDPPSELFPVNPKQIFSNISTEAVGALTVRKEMCWLQYNEQNDILSVQIVVRATVSVALSFRHFPFDRHIIPFKVKLRSWKETPLSGGKTVKKAWHLPAEIPEWAEPTVLYDEDRTILTETHVPKGEFTHVQPIALLGQPPDLTKSQKSLLGGQRLDPYLCLCVERQPSKFILSVAVPIAIVVLLALTNFWVPASTKSDAILTSALAVTTFRNTVVTNDIPGLTYLTFADMYIIFVFAFHLLMSLTVVYRGSIDDDGVNQEFTDFAITALWVVPHLLLIVDAAWMWLSHKDGPITWLLRKDWKQELAEAKESMKSSNEACRIDMH